MLCVGLRQECESGGGAAELIAMALLAQAATLATEFVIAGWHRLRCYTCLLTTRQNAITLIWK